MNANYPTWVCTTCGIAASRATFFMKYGKLPQKDKVSISTYHLGFCDVCGEHRGVTQPRDFFYPNFNILNKMNEYERLRKLGIKPNRTKGTAVRPTVFWKSEIKRTWRDRLVGFLEKIIEKIKPDYY